MLDYEIQRCTRRCAGSDRELQPGDTFYSMLVAQGGEVVRLDFSESAWQGPSGEALGWWKSQMPAAHAKKMSWAPHEVMLHFFEQLADQTDKADLRYVLALLMIRRRILKLEESVTDEQQECMKLSCARNETEYLVPIATPTQDRVDEIQNELAQLLFADAT